MKELKSVTKLIDSFSKLPGVGHRSAEKMAYAVLEMSDEDAEMFSDALKELKRSVHHCPICGAYTESELCEVCSDENRDKTKIIVVSYPKDIEPFEKLGNYNGRYHVLGGVLSAVNGVGINDLRIDSLEKRIKEDGIQEVIIATNPDVEGEATAMYIARLLKPLGIKVTRLAQGISMGSDLEFADEVTLSKAIEARREI